MRFTKTTLDKMLDEIVQVYMQDGFDIPIWEVIAQVKEKYRGKIESLDK